MILDFALKVAFVAVGLAMALCVWRLIRGPSVCDRLLALDTLYINTIVLILLLGLKLNSELLVEAALLIALLGFVSTVALARYVSRGDPGE